MVLEDKSAYRLGQLGSLPVVFTAASGLPFALRSSCDRCLDGVRRRTEIMLRDVADAGGLASRIGGEPGRAAEVSRRPHRVASDSPRLHHRQITRGPGAGRGDRLPRSGVVHPGELEEAEHVLGTVGGPQRQKLVVGVGERPSPPDGDEPWVPGLRQDHDGHTRDMTHHSFTLADTVRGQWVRLPDLYSPIDPDVTPHRFTTDPDVASALPPWIASRTPILQDPAVVELMRTATLLGDAVGDALALRAKDLGARTMIDMLRRACREGITSVPDAPAELVALIEDMEAIPAWVDMDLVAEGARESRVPAAYLTPFIIRGVFLGTFTNTYSALPMALTGALTSTRAAHRVRETAAFFTVTTMPEALERHGPGFEAAAVVRLMHSMVRVTALTGEGGWDASTYGMPIPQVDQMPAGMVNMYLLARKVQSTGAGRFNARERAVVEFTRYRCFLLGLPDELLPTTPAGVIRVFHARGALLRDDFDDATCGELIRSTIAARLSTGGTVARIGESIERSWSKVAFCRAFCDGDRERAATMGVEVTASDRLRVGLTAPFVLGRMTLAVLLSGVPLVRDVVDALTIRILRRRLRAYGPTE